MSGSGRHSGAVTINQPRWAGEVELHSRGDGPRLLSVYLKGGAVIRFPVTAWHFRKRVTGEFTALTWTCSGEEASPALVGVRLGEIAALVEETITGTVTSAR